MRRKQLHFGNTAFRDTMWVKRENKSKPRAVGRHLRTPT